jgi:hypothetical protein
VALRIDRYIAISVQARVQAILCLFVFPPFYPEISPRSNLEDFTKITEVNGKRAKPNDFFTIFFEFIKCIYVKRNRNSKKKRNIRQKG